MWAGTVRDTGDGHGVEALSTKGIRPCLSTRGASSKREARKIGPQTTECD
jgi:molybdopterin synthase catalytic subunit